MGLFSNKDKPCPICGGATPRLLATKIEGRPICGKCNDKIMADEDLVSSWTLGELQEHLRAREENLKMVENFTPTRTVEYEHTAVIDDRRRLFYIKQWTVDNPPVFRFDDIAGFTIKLGYQVVESWSRGMARTPFQPAQLGIIGSLAALAEAFDDNKSDSRYENLEVTLNVNAPYISEYELCDLSVGGKGQAGFTEDLSREMAKVNTICNLIVSMAEESGHGTPSSAAGVSADHTVDSIVKYKKLLDAGVITEAEFDAKKKQLLGI